MLVPDIGIIATKRHALTASGNLAMNSFNFDSRANQNITLKGKNEPLFLYKICLLFQHFMWFVYKL